MRFKTGVVIKVLYLLKTTNHMSLNNYLKSKKFLTQFVYPTIGVIILISLLMLWLNIKTNHNQKIKIPNLLGISITQAKKIISNLNLRFEIIDSTTYNPAYNKQSIIGQSPEPGSFVKENRKIYLTINPLKYKDIFIPNIFGKPNRQAIAELKSVGFIVGNNPVYVSDMALDIVRGIKFKDKELKLGEKLPLNSMVELILGDGNFSENTDSLPNANESINTNEQQN